MTPASASSPGGQFSIVARADRSAAAPRVLKQGDSFAVFDARGDMVGPDAPELGLYHAGTRFLSRLELLLSNHRPLLLSSTITDDNALFSADLTNPDFVRDDQVTIPHGALHLFRCRTIRGDTCFDRVRVSSYVPHEVSLALALHFEADFADVFEVRGAHRPRRGDLLGVQLAEREQVMRYRGLDGVERRTRVTFDRRPDGAQPGHVTFVLDLEPGRSTDLEIQVACEGEDQAARPASHGEAIADVRRLTEARAERGCRITSANEALTRWVRRSTADLHMMETQTPHGPFPYAGIPWFCTPFGRDGIVTALQLLWADPGLARGVLAFLAATQATGFSDERDAQPGKILHEMREGEMPALGEVPFARYYGSADATPLFVLLACAYFDRTGDGAFIDTLWPHLLAALEWMRASGDPDGDGFIDYARRSGRGLIQQGWKDSHDSVFHADGRLAPPPIALCEVQAYAYGAWAGAARLADVRGEPVLATEWRVRAGRLREDFDDAFWCAPLGTYALAIDGEGRPCQVRTSNAGHCLFTGIARPERAALVCATLMEDRSFAGWGVRTVAAGEARYNPMSYHNGSVWPHDTAIVAAGLSRYGYMEAAARIATGLLDLSQVVDLNRLPELICGFHRRGGDRPTLYPVACAPQAWAAGAVYMALQACLGLEISATERRVTLRRAILPDNVAWVDIANLQVGAASLDLRLDRHAHDVGMTVLRREGDVEIVAIA